MNGKTAGQSVAERHPPSLFAIKKVTPSYEPQAWQAEGCERCQHCLLVRQQAWQQIDTKSPNKAHD